MKTRQILKELSYHLSDLLMIQIRLSMSIDEPILLCLSICDVVHQYNGTRDNEKTVSKLLSRLLKNHSSKYKP